MLEQCATKGYEIPPGMPSMQNLQSGPPPPPPLESPTEDHHAMDSDPASAQLHAQQASYQGHDGDSDMSGTGHAGPGDGGDGSGAPTAPMQDIAQQAMVHGNEHGKPTQAGSTNENRHYGPPLEAQIDNSKIDPAVTGA